jgi:hypothetical protein
MQEDKNLKELLMKWGVEHPSADFTSQVMQRITAASIANAHTASLLRQRLLQVLLGVFILVCIVLLVLCFTASAAFPFQLIVSLPAKYLSQGFSFIIAFWVVMFLNLVSKKYYLKHYRQ